MKISERARQGFDQIVQHCMRMTLVPAGQSECGITAIDAPAPSGGVVMLTVASSSFSLVLFLHYDEGATSRAQMAALHGLNAEEMDEQAFEDALAETGNLCCGALNRELGRVFPLVGMSTPHRLDAHCVDHLGLLRHNHVRHFRLMLSDGSHRLAHYCVRAYGDLDFVAPPMEADIGVGELELF